jgi:pyruvate/2-oxoglutarate/acetoin dehydrogenase E1 component
MAEADLDGVIRSIAKTQHKALMDAAKKRQGRLMELAARAKDKAAKAQYKQTAKDTLLLAGAAARRMQIAAENAADSYARAVKKAAEDLKQAAEAEQAKLAKKAAEKAAKPPAKKSAKKAVPAKKAAKKSNA